MSCKKIMKLIDRMERPDVLPYEAARHLDSCESCAGFAAGRMRLRELLASSGRVTAPANFDAMLRVRLTERSEARPLAWFGSASYLRYGAAAIAFVCLLLLGQQIVRNNKSTPRAEDSGAAVDGSLGSGNRVLPPATFGPGDGGPSLKVPPNVPGNTGMGNRPLHAIRPRGNSGLRYVADIGEQMDPGARAAAVLLMRGPSAEGEVMIPAVSVGAQPIFYSYREPQPSHGGRIHF